MQPDRERSNAFVEADEQYVEILGKSVGGGPFFSMYAETMQESDPTQGTQVVRYLQGIQYSGCFGVDPSSLHEH